MVKVIGQQTVTNNFTCPAIYFGVQEALIQQISA